MPFQPNLPRPFSVRTIQAHVPQTSGVYGLSSGREWIFIGQTDDLQHTLLDHCAESGTPVSLRLPTGFSYEICAPSLRSIRQERLIAEFDPVCNKTPVQPARTALERAKRLRRTA